MKTSFVCIAREPFRSSFNNMSYRNTNNNAEDIEGEEEEEEEVPQQVAELAQASVPNALRGIRACKRCGILKTLDQFVDHGCENCPFLEMVRGMQTCPNLSLLLSLSLLLFFMFRNCIGAWFVVRLDILFFFWGLFWLTISVYLYLWNAFLEPLIFFLLWVHFFILLGPSLTNGWTIYIFLRKRIQNKKNTTNPHTRRTIPSDAVFVPRPSLKGKQRLWIHEKVGLPNGFVWIIICREYMPLVLRDNLIVILKKI